ncbi:MAG: integrase core domain-containing protein [Gaiellaceae bacterium]
MTASCHGRRFPSYDAEHEILDWIGFYNEERLHEALDDAPPVSPAARK